MFWHAPATQAVSVRALEIDHPAAVRAVGDFNGWKPAGTPLLASTDGTVWTLKLKLEPDVYAYVLLENSDAVPTGDELTAATKTLIVTPPEYAEKPGVPGDGVITGSVVRHRADADVSKVNDRTFQLVLRTRKSDVASVSATVNQTGHDQKSYAMVIDHSNELFDYYRVKVVVDPGQPFLYRFMLDDGSGGRAFDSRGLSGGVIGGGQAFQVDPAKVSESQSRVQLFAPQNFFKVKSSQYPA